MILRGMFGVLLVACCALVANAQEKLAEQASPEEIEKFVRLALMQGAGNFALAEYTHLQKLRVTETDKQGKTKEVISTVKETFVPSRLKKGKSIRWIYVLIEKNGKPVSPAEIEKERLKAGERLVKEEEALQKNPPSAEEQAQREKLPPPRGIYFSISNSGGPFGGGLSFSVRSLMYFCTFSNPRYVTVNNRQMVLLDFAPPPDAGWDGSESYKARLVGQAWFDLSDIMLAKLEAWPQGTARPEKPYVFYESLRTPDGQWMPSLIVMNTSQRKVFFNREVGDIRVEFTDYQRFGSEVKDVQMKEPIK